MREATRDECRTVIGWLTEKGGDELASTWVWECTPMPCGAPTYEQAWEGVCIAAGDLDINDVLRQVYDEMSRLAAEQPSKGRDDG